MIIISKRSWQISVWIFYIQSMYSRSIFYNSGFSFANLFRYIRGKRLVILLSCELQLCGNGWRFAIQIPTFFGAFFSVLIDQGTTYNIVQPGATPIYSYHTLVLNLAVAIWGEELIRNSVVSANSNASPGSYGDNWRLQFTHLHTYIHAYVWLHWLTWRCQPIAI